MQSPLSHTKIKKSAQTNSIVLTKNNHHPPPPPKKIYPLVVVESVYLLLPPSPLHLHPIHLSSSPLLLVNLIEKDLHNFASSTNRLLSTINLSLQHTSRTNRLLRAVNFSLKHASGSNGLLGAVDHFAELELLREGVVGEHILGLGSECVCLFLFFVWGSVNEWMRRKGEDGRGGVGGFM